MRSVQSAGVRIPTLARDVRAMMDRACQEFPDAETFIRMEDGAAVLYAVERTGGGQCVVLVSRPIPFFPEEA